MTVIIGIEFIGGLGNTFFQFGFIYSLAKRFDCKFTITNLDCWSSPHQTVSYDWFKNMIYSCPNFIHGFNEEFDVFTESHPFVLQAIDSIKCNTLFKGYYQCISYIDDSVYRMIFDTLPPVDFHKKTDDAIFIHVRLGDYVNIPEAQLQENYYQDALKIFTQGVDNFKLHVFSNDIIGARNVVPDADEYIDTDEVTSLVLLTRYKLGGICANSSFSWWASQLNFSPNKIIVMPKRWGTKMPDEEIDLYPQNFVLV